MREQSSGYSTDGFVSSRQMIKLHHAVCEQCRACHHDTGQLVDWGGCLEGAAVVSIAAAGPPIDFMWSASADDTRLRHAWERRAIGPTGGPHSFVHTHRPDGQLDDGPLVEMTSLCEKQRAVLRASGVKLSKSGTQLSLPPELQAQHATVSPVFMVSRPVFRFRHSPASQWRRLDELGTVPIAQVSRDRDTHSKPRAVGDYRALNSVMTSFEFTMHQLDDRVADVRDGDYLGAQDVAGAYLTVYVLPRHRHHHLLAARESSTTWSIYEPRHCVFGLKISAGIFILLSSAIVKGMQSYLPPATHFRFFADDLLTRSATEAGAAAAQALAVSGFAEAGMALKEAKTTPPSQEITYLGRVVATCPTVTVSLPSEKAALVRALLAAVIQEARFSPGAAESCIGVCANAALSTADIFGVAKAASWALWDEFTMCPWLPRQPGLIRASASTLTTSVWNALRRLALEVASPAAATLPAADVRWGMTWTDASSFGAGGLVLLDKGCQPFCCWLGRELTVDEESPDLLAERAARTSSSARELAAVAAALSLVPKQHLPLMLVCVTDSSALSIALAKRRSGSRVLGPLVQALLIEARTRNIVMIPVHVSRVHLRFADVLSRICAFPSVLACVPRLSHSASDILGAWRDQQQAELDRHVFETGGMGYSNPAASRDGAKEAVSIPEEACSH